MGPPGPTDARKTPGPTPRVGGIRIEGVGPARRRPPDDRRTVNDPPRWTGSDRQRRNRSMEVQSRPVARPPLPTPGPGPVRLALAVLARRASLLACSWRWARRSETGGKWNGPDPEARPAELQEVCRYFAAGVLEHARKRERVATQTPASRAARRSGVPILLSESRRCCLHKSGCVGRYPCASILTNSSRERAAHRGSS